MAYIYIHKPIPPNMSTEQIEQTLAMDQEAADLELAKCPYDKPSAVVSSEHPGRIMISGTPEALAWVWRGGFLPPGGYSIVRDEGWRPMGI